MHILKESIGNTFSPLRNMSHWSDSFISAPPADNLYIYIEFRLDKKKKDS